MTFTASLDDIIAINNNGLLAGHKSWPRVELRSVCSITNGFPFLSDRFSTSEGVPLIRIRDIAKGETATYYNGEYDETYLVQSGELLVGMDGDFHSAVWRGRPALLNQRCCKINANPKWIDRRFIAYLLPGYLAAIHANTAAQTVKHLSSNTIGDIKLPLPPLEEQNRLCDKIDGLFVDLDAGVAGLNRIKTNLKRYRASVLQAAVEGRLTAEWRKQNPPSETGAELLERLLKERRAKWEENQLKKYAEQGKTPPRKWKEKYPEPVKPDTNGLPELPEGWVWGTMEELSSGDPYSLAIGPFGSNLKVTDYTEEGVPLVFVRNIRSNEFFGKKCVYVSREKARDLFPHQVSPGDILVTKMGDPPGDVCLYPELSQDAIITADCIKLRLNAILTDKTYFTKAIEANATRKQIFKVTKGVAQQKITLAAFGRVCLPLPPMLEQRQIVDEVNARLNIADATNEAIHNALQRADRLRQSILKRAFEGRLVAQDPNDEPASVLLERIRAERAAQAATVKPARAQRKAKGHAG